MILDVPWIFLRACCVCSVPQNQASIRKMPISHCTISGFVVIEIQRAIERWGGDVRNVLQRWVKILSFQNVALPKWYLCHFVFMSPSSVSRVWILIRDSVDLCDIMQPQICATCEMCTDYHFSKAVTRERDTGIKSKPI